MTRNVRFTEVVGGTPAFLAESELDGLYAVGVLHGRHRPLQALLLNTAGRGRLAAEIAPKGQLLAIDTVVHQLDLPRRGREAASQLDDRTAARIDSYLEGLVRGIAEGGRPFELRALFARLPTPDRATFLAGFLAASYLGLAEGQWRMERALVEAVREGASTALLEQMFAPHLTGWDPARYADLVPPTPIARATAGSARPRAVGSPVGGSNAWAVAAHRSKSGAALLGADPHLAINQLPALLFELSGRVGDDYWLGATIPGLPGIAVGRNKRLAWGGTFGVADNVDLAIEPEPGRGEVRTVRLRRRGLRGRNLRCASTERGLLDWDGVATGPALASRWAGGAAVVESIAAYLDLQLAKSVDEAERALRSARVFSLHFVLADRAGRVRYVQVGNVPRRTGGWSGLAPSTGEQGWDGFIGGDEMPASDGEDGVVASANEARVTDTGRILSTLAQPPHRRERIREVLLGKRDHDLQSFQRLQLDLRSRHAVLHKARFSAVIADGAEGGAEILAALGAWDDRFDADSIGAHAYALVWRAFVASLAPELGGEWYAHALDNTEIRNWWGRGFEQVLTTAWTDERKARFCRRLDEAARATPLARWGDVQQLSMNHLIFGGVGLGFDRGPYPFEGATTTVRQATLLSMDGAPLAIGPAYRMVADLSEDAAYTSIPGGIDGSRFSGSYTCWLDEYLAGGYHRLTPPDA